MSDDFASLILLFPVTLCSKLERRFTKHSVSMITIDGVESTIRKTSEQIDETIKCVATIAMKLFTNSSLVHLKSGDLISIGLPSNNPDKYLLDGSKPSSVRLQSVQVAQGHVHTLEFTLKCSRELMDRIQEWQYVGLNGSGFYIQSKTDSSFSVHAGQNTREKTLFTEALSPETPLTLTFPH